MVKFIFDLEAVIISLYFVFVAFYPLIIFGLIVSAFGISLRKTLLLAAKLNYPKLPKSLAKVIFLLGVLGIPLFLLILILFTSVFVGSFFGLPLSMNYEITFVLESNYFGLYVGDFNILEIYLTVFHYILLFFLSITYSGWNYRRKKKKYKEIRERIMKKWLNIKGIYEVK
ncbi:MAG: hypothetical protein J7L47_07960 [Candidatus Odinarchaeota archaeon]|nr:hypothetical protein [Candidatus Odinarchaeota archaeon]